MRWLTVRLWIFGLAWLFATVSAKLPWERGKLRSPKLRKAAISALKNCTDSSQPIPPSQDPWYTATRGFESKTPGSVLRLREAPGNTTKVTGNSSEAYHILFRTTDSRYLPTWAVTTLFLPKTDPKPALLSYQTPYDSADVDAGPSYSMYLSQLPDVSQALGLGWIVTVPDYEGPLASFTAGVMSGHATIDAIRASIEACQILGLPDDLTLAMWGYSGGALASEWALELQVQYAPELNISGAAIGGLTPNVTSVLMSINGKLEAGLAPPAIIGLSSQFPDVEKYVKSRLKRDGPYNKTGFLASKNFYLDQNIMTYALHNISEYFLGGINDLTGSALVQKVLRSDGLMGYHGVPQCPLYVYKAVKDEVSDIRDTDKLVNKYCEFGTNILYERNDIGGHSAEAVNGRPASIKWLQSILNGTHTEDYGLTGCVVRNVSVAISTLAY